MGAGRAAVDLGERLKQRRQRIGGDSPAAVAHAEAHECLRGGGGLAFGADHHLALVGELHRVADQVDEDLAQQPRVAANPGGNLRIDVGGERDALLARGHRDDVRNPFDDRDKIERGVLALDLVGLDLGEIEDVVDDRQQVVRGGPRDLRELCKLGGQFRVKHEVETADDSIHRSTDLVAHGRKELGFDHGRAQTPRRERRRAFARQPCGR